MPFYVYKCKNCSQEFKTFHSMNEQLHNCEHCSTDNSLEKIPSLLTSYNVDRERVVAGERVGRFIEDSRQLLKDSKQDIRKEYK